MSDLPKYGTLDGEQVELTDAFVLETPDIDLEKVVVEIDGRELRPFKSCRELPEDQIGAWA